MERVPHPRKWGVFKNYKETFLFGLLKLYMQRAKKPLLRLLLMNWNILNVLHPKLAILWRRRSARETLLRTDKSDLESYYYKVCCCWWWDDSWFTFRSNMIQAFYARVFIQLICMLSFISFLCPTTTSRENSEDERHTLIVHFQCVQFK